MDFLLFVFGVFTLSVAWRARRQARQANELASRLQRELTALRDAVHQMWLAPDAARPPAPAPVATRETQASATPPAVDAVSPEIPDALRPDANADYLPDMAALVAAAARPAAPAESTTSMPKPEQVPTLPPTPTPSIAPPATAPLDSTPATAGFGWSDTHRAPSRPPPQPTTTEPLPQWLLTVKNWLFGGNLVAKLGLLILFIGVSFLLKYTAARVSVPIEFRLAGIVLADIALLAWGWRIRLRRPAISLPVQGAALAVLMLVTFGAFRLYHLIPGGLAFAVLFLLTVFTCMLAVLQDAMWLAIFGIVGGFAAPILASSGGGSHIGLFSYYALLNAGVLTLALWRAWRPLNLLGFAFTFIISTAWGVLRYAPENYLSVQLFLILFFVFYVSIPLAYARKQAVALKHYVDGTLIFGTPMLGFGLQFSLVRQFEFGVAFSALALGLFYISLATALRRRPTLALLSDAFLALGVVFGTLAIPFALDGRWTSAAWALEGAGIVWIGLRQKQPMAWGFGLLVQAGAWLSFVGTISGLSAQRAADANLWLGFLLLAITAFLMATRFRAQPEGGNRWFTALASLFLAFATVWLIAGAWTEIVLRTDGTAQANLLVISGLLAATALYFIARKMDWPLARKLALVAQALAGVTLLGLMLRQTEWFEFSANLFDKPVLGSLLICVAALFTSWTLKRHGDDGPGNVNVELSRLMLLWGAMWWLVLVLRDLAGWLAARYLLLTHDAFTPDQSLALYAYGMLLAATAFPAVLLARRLQWQDLRLLAVPTWLALAGATFLITVYTYLDSDLPRGAAWLAYAALWLSGEWLLRAWPTSGWSLPTAPLQLLHGVRTVGPWLLIWPVSAYWITHWLLGGDDARMLAEAGWSTDPSWARFIPAWLMMAATGWLLQRSRAGGWPVAPIASLYQQRIVPGMVAWALVLVALWNLTQDGAMAPLPYIPLLNPLDLTTCFAMLLAYSGYGLLAPRLGELRTHLPVVAALVGYGWFNLALLRTVSHYLEIPYNFDDMFSSQFVQAMLSLVWSVTALILMRHAAQRANRGLWIAGAVLLGVVVLKLFMVDLSNVGGVERIVSFLGVGALMVGIGYLAPYPTTADNQTETA